MINEKRAHAVKYAGIGSRKTPSDVINMMVEIGHQLARAGYVLRTGGAEGADEAFIIGSEVDLIDWVGPGGEAEVYLPWPTYNGWGQRSSWPGRFDNPTSDALALAKLYHPNWYACSQGARKLHARNMHIVAGINLDDPVDFVVCWTPNGKGSGGTGQALRFAHSLNITVFDLGDDEKRPLIEKAIDESNLSH